MTRSIITPLGAMVAVTDGDAIISLDFTDDVSMSDNSDHPLLLQLEKELEEYFTETRTSFSLPLNPTGTLFQKSVWQTLLTIPYGETLSYADEAKRFGKPKAIRAVANANGRNPIAILIPCHRVIATGGGLGGYSGGIEKKEFLLKLEKPYR
jgi:methylated-DNA-[protein]-cysteine S-methyltransferase